MACMLCTVAINGCQKRLLVLLNGLLSLLQWGLTLSADCGVWVGAGGQQVCCCMCYVGGAVLISSWVWLCLLGCCAGLLLGLAASVWGGGSLGYLLAVCLGKVYCCMRAVSIAVAVGCMIGCAGCG